MGLFSRRSKGETPDEPADASPSVWEVDDDLSGGGDAPGPGGHTGRPVSAPLGEADRERIAAALDRARERGVDVDDLASIGAGYDRAFTDWRDGRSGDGGSGDGGSGDGPDLVVDTFAIAIGEHLVRRSAREWAVVTDVFGTDLGLIEAKADAVVVPHNLVGARWMRGETGWVPGVVSHLVRLRPRQG